MLNVVVNGPSLEAIEDTLESDLEPRPYNFYDHTLPEVFEHYRSDLISGTEAFMREHVLNGEFLEPSYIPATSGSRALSLPSGQKVFRGSHDRRMRWTLPAHGARCKSGGNPLDIEVCPTGHYGRVITCHCDRISCPICSPTTIYRRASTVAQELIASANAEKDTVGYQHVIISPPQRDAIRLMSSEKGYKSMRGAVREILGGLGARNALTVFHPWREQGDKGRWVLGPHFHSFVYGWLDLGSDWVKSLHDLGWIVKVIPKNQTAEGLDIGLSRSPYWTREDLLHGVGYILSHAGVGRPEGASRDSPVYFMSNYFVKVAEVTTKEYVPCSVCRDKHPDYPHNLHSFMSLRGCDPLGLTENRTVKGGSSILRVERSGVFIRKDHLRKFLLDVMMSYNGPSSLRGIFRNWLAMGVLGCRVDLMRDDWTLNVQRVNNRGEIVRGDVSPRMYSVILPRIKGWSPEQFDAFEDVHIVDTFSRAIKKGGT